MEHKIKELVTHFWQQAKELGYITDKPKPPIYFDLKGACAGRAYSGRCYYLRFNIPLLNRASEKELRQTVGHEVVHIAQALYDGYCDGHGRRWKAAMVRFGLEPKRCHNYDTTGLVREQKRLDFSCACGVQYKLSATIVNKIKRGQTRVCSRCKREVTL